MVTIEPTLRRRIAQATQLPNNLDPLLRQIYANRGITSEVQLERSLKGLLHYQTLTGIETAISLLIEALQQQSRIVIVGDFDADGATSTALAIKALRQMGFKQVSYHIPNRFDDGYGLSTQVVHDVAKKGLISLSLLIMEFPLLKVWIQLMNMVFVSSLLITIYPDKPYPLRMRLLILT